MEDEGELVPTYFLRDLADRLMNVPGTYGTDQYDTDRLYSIARAIEAEAPTLDDRAP
jgi:hypothetical protein